MIYWTVSNLLGIGQQYATNHIIGRPIVQAGSAARRTADEERGIGNHRQRRDKATQIP